MSSTPGDLLPLSGGGAASSSSGPGSARGGRFGKPGFWFATAAVLLVASTLVAVRQEPRADVYRTTGPRDVEWWLRPVEFNAQRRLPLVWSDLNDVFVLRGNGEAGPQVWVVGDGGLILHSADLGRSWKRLELVTGDARPPAAAAAATRNNRPSSAAEDLTRSDLRSVCFVDPKTGWVAGDQGALSVTRDGGKTWERQQVIDPGAPTVAKLRLSQLIFEGRSKGWLTAGVWWLGRLRGWVRYQTEDGGRHWLQAKLDSQHLRVRASTVDFTVAAGFVGPHVQFQDLEPSAPLSSRSRDWPGPYLPLLQRHGALDGLYRVRTPETIEALDEVVPGSLWVVGTNGAALRTSDNGRTWIARDLGTRENLTGIQFLDVRHGWITGAAGTLLATEDGGETWLRQTRKTSALGSDPIANSILAARDAASPGPYSMWLAPWYFVSLIAVAALLVPALRPQAPVADSQPSVAERLISDRAIDRREADAFDFNAVALGLSRFLRNAKTEPPLTIAITGEWGSGKSSLMNLVRVDLQRYGFRPVWFNAWHHQKEEHLLASLLEAVRVQGVSPWWRPEGALLRAKLLRIRAARYWPLMVVLLVALSFSAGYVRSEPGRLDAAESAAAKLLAKLGAPDLSADTAAKPAGTPGKGAEHLPLTALVVATAGLLAAAARGAKAFGVNPARLLAGRSTKVRDLAALTGFRHRFAAEFCDVTAALNPRTMLILIDDLDRCRPEMVLEVLEAVNFLVTSGECFVILGMARDRVMRCVGLSFKDVASELLETPAKPPEGMTEEDVARQRRLEFAQQYLEKLINIEVPVPLPTDEQSRRLLVDEGAAEAASGPGRWQELLAATRHAVPVAAIGVLLIGGFIAGLLGPSAPPPALGPASSPAKIAHGRPRPMPPPISVESEPVADAGSRPPETVPAPPPVPAGPMQWQRLPFVLLGLVLAGFGAWRLSVPPDIVIHDSREFEEALSRWHPLIFSWRNTPRAIKRYLNRVRYLAMLQREPVPTPALWRRIGDGVRRRGDEQRSAGRAAPIPEQVLVALSALELRHAGWITGDRPLAAYAREPGADARVARLLADGLDLDTYLNRYRELARGIRGGTEQEAA